MVDNFKFELEQEVIIKRTGNGGTVHGINIDRHGHHAFLVKYADANSAIFDKWFDEKELESFENKAAE